MSRARVLLVDNDPGQLELLSMRLEAAGYEVNCAGNGEQALAAIKRRQPEVVLSDLRMEGMDGLALFERIHREWPTLPVIILTAHGSIRDAVQATQSGVFSFITKPVAPAELLTTLERALELRSPASVQPSGWAQHILTRSAKMYQLLDQARLVAQSDVNVLISGESGTGKELLAQAIHQGSLRAEGPFMPINCSAIPENLLESELFGHRKGAFTGASRDHPGLFVASAGGTVFLDEIGDMPPSLQVKVLRVLQERRVRPVGATDDQPIDVRILSATHRDLEAALTDGSFREDLYYRLNVVELRLPSLRERSEDIPLLANSFLRHVAERQGSKPVRLAPAAVGRLLRYSWPGNIRQLQNVIEKLVALAVGPVISEAQVREALPLDRGADIAELSEAKARFERGYMIRLLQLTAGNIAEAAQLAGRNRSDLYKVIKRHGIDLEQFKTTAGELPTEQG
ncbi:sigma 54-interacting transcriptional regulator [Kineobactrum salinum]|nr:sigma 54-interacting transcriptional regulator [Kineobactrum salinum]